jgi:hypothetical protein
MHLDGELAVVRYELNVWATQGPIERCPTGAIVWFATPNQAVKGAVAKKILRQDALPQLR